MSAFFPHVKPSREAMEAMSAAALELDTTCCAHKSIELRETLEAVSRATKHRYVKFVSSGSAAVLAALKGVGGKVIIPDQGAWTGFRKYPKLLGMEAVEIPTNLGVIDPKILLDEIKKHEPRGLLLTSFAGYIAEQNVKEISAVCRENGVLLVEDASGAIGDEKLADGRYADIIVCSTGSPKILNVLSGGFISTNDRSILDSSLEIIRACKISPITCAGITEELRRAAQVVKALVKCSAELKDEIARASRTSFAVVHKEKRGVCFGFELDGSPAEFIMRAREKGLKTEFDSTLLTSCPRYERFMRKGIVVELKKLDILNIEYERIMDIAKILRLCAD